MCNSKRKNLKSEIDDIELGYKKPDGGYGWIVFIVAFLMMFCLNGCHYSFKIFSEIMFGFYGEKFDSLKVCFFYMSAQVSAAFASQFGVKPVVMVTSFIFLLIYVISVYMSSIYLTIFFGMIEEIAFGCCYHAIFIVLVDYFGEKLGIVNAIILLGRSLGGVAYSVLDSFLIFKIGSQYIMIIIALITVPFCVLGALLKPVTEFIPKPTKPTIELRDLNDDSSHVEPLTDNADNEQAKTKPTCSEIIINILSQLSSVKLLKENKSFLFISLANFFVFLVHIIAFAYISIDEKNAGISNESFIIITIVIFSLLFTIIFGLLCDRKIASAIDINMICTLLASVSLLSYFFLNTFLELIVFAAVFGIATAGMNFLTTLCLVEIVGSKHFGNANGIINMFIGVGCICGPFIARFIYEKTNRVFFIFVFADISYTIAFVCSFLAALFHRRHMKHLNELMSGNEAQD